MKIISVKKKSIVKATMGIIFILIVGAFSTSFGMQDYYKLDFSTGLVTATTLNVRSGPSTKYPIVATVKKNEYIRVLAGIGVLAVKNRKNICTDIYWKMRHLRPVLMSHF